MRNRKLIFMFGSVFALPAIVCIFYARFRPLPDIVLFCAWAYVVSFALAGGVVGALTYPDTTREILKKRERHFPRGNAIRTWIGRHLRDLFAPKR